MQWKIAISIVVLLLSTPPLFGQGATASLYGEWLLDAKATRVEVRESGGAVETIEEDEATSVTFNFRLDGKLRMVGIEEGVREDVAAGTWKVLAEKPGRLELELAFTGEPAPVKATVILVDNDMVRMVVKNEDVVERMVLRRVKMKP